MIFLLCSICLLGYLVNETQDKEIMQSINSNNQMTQNSDRNSWMISDFDLEVQYDFLEHSREIVNIGQNSAYNEDGYLYFKPI